MTQTLTTERLREIASSPSFSANPLSHEVKYMARELLASREAQPVAYIGAQMLEDLTDGARSCGRVWARSEDELSGDDRLALYAAPPAPAVPDEQHSERFEWTYGEWARHLGGRHQNNDPANYYEFGSFIAVAEMLRQFGNVQRKVGWNACRAAMLAQPVSQGYKLVPVEPTEEMIAAAMNCDDVEFNSDETFCVNFDNIYRAMLAAEPDGGST